MPVLTNIHITIQTLLHTWTCCNLLIREYYHNGNNAMVNKMQLNLLKINLVFKPENELLCACFLLLLQKYEFKE